MRGIATLVAIPIIAAFLLETPLYLAPLFAGVRAAAIRINRWAFAGLLAFTAILPYLIYSLPTGCFNALDLFRITGLALTLSFWYLIFPAAIWSDLIFLAAPSAVVLSKILKQIYWSPLPHETIYVLGVLMLTHVCALAMLVLRGLKGVNPGLIPAKREAWIALRAFVFFLPVGFALVWLLHLKTHPPVWKAAPIFFGIYLGTAFSEEFAFRGVLQQHLTKIFGFWPALILASAVFGLAHLSFANIYPNWRMVALAAPAGLFYGWAYHASGSIRASMLAHALTVTVWTIWLR